MENKAKQQITQFLLKFGTLFQLSHPSADYVDALYDALHSQQWTLKEFAQALNQLANDKEYAESARFGKYPILYDYLRIRRQMKAKPFYDALTSYLAGNWFEKDTVLALATPEQMNAITAAGGLSKLYERANNSVPTPVYKLVDIVAQNESDSPTAIIDTSHRIGKPTSIKKISNIFQKNT